MQRLAPLSPTDLGRRPRSQSDSTLTLPGWLVPAWIAGIVVAGAALRVVWAFQAGLHPDEALYASWALRIADGNDLLLLAVYVDKPPFLPYLLAGIAALAGSSPASVASLQQLAVIGRLAAVAASLASLALLWDVARALYGRRVAALAAAFFALSPLATRLSPSLLTDPWLVLWMLLGLWSAQRRRPWLAGIACGLAFASKQQALLILPLALAAFLLFHSDSPSSRRPVAQRRALWRLLGGFALIAVIVLWWDSQRWQWMPSYWERSATAYGGLSLIPLSQLGQHLAGWIEVLATVLGLPLLLLAAILWAGRLLAAIRERGGQPAPAALPTAAGRFDLLLGLFLAGYLALHLVTSLAPWDRYALPLTPVLALLLARGAVWWVDRLVRRGQQRALLALVAVVAAGSLWAMVLTATPRFPVADNAAYDGAPALAGHIRLAEPASPVVYHHRLGWHFGYFLYGSDSEVRWWQTPEDLAQQAARDAGRRQLVALTDAEDRAGLEAALRVAGLALAPVTVATHPDGSPSASLYSVEPLAGAMTGD